MGFEQFQKDRLLFFLCYPTGTDFTSDFIVYARMADDKPHMLFAPDKIYFSPFGKERYFAEYFPFLIVIVLFSSSNL